MRTSLKIVRIINCSEKLLTVPLEHNKIGVCNFMVYYLSMDCVSVLQFNVADEAVMEASKYTELKIISYIITDFYN